MTDDLTALLRLVKLRRSLPSGAELQAIRVRADVSLRELAKGLGIDYTSLWRWEQRGVLPRPGRKDVEWITRALRLIEGLQEAGRQDEGS